MKLEIEPKLTGQVKRIGCYAHTRAEEDSGTRELTWNKNHSSIVVAKAAEAALIHGKDIASFIHNHDDVMDFMLRTKVPKNSYLVLATNVKKKQIPMAWTDETVTVDDFSDSAEKRIQNVSRYYVSETGGLLVKIMPPTDKLIEKWNTVAHWQHVDNGKTVNAPKAPSGKYKLINKPSTTPPDRRMGITVGWQVTVCNSLKGHEFNDINYDYYIAEARKLVDELK